MTSALGTSYTATKGSHAVRVAFLTNARVAVPDVAWAMQATGDAVVLGEGGGAAAGGSTYDWPLVAGYVAKVRASELVGEAHHFDVEVQDNAEAEATAVRAVKRPIAKRPGSRSPVAPSILTWKPDATYSDTPYPSKEMRILGLFRFWSVIHYFYPYLPLMGDAWEEALAEFLPRFEAAADESAYAAAVSELAARIPDSHVRVWGSKAVSQLRPTAAPPFEVQMVEGQVAVSAIFDPTAVQAAGLAVGDVIEKVDGEPVTDRMARLGKNVAASNERSHSFFTGRAAMAGDPGTDALLAVQRANGVVREVRLPRRIRTKAAQRSGPVYRLLDDAVGYVDLDRLEVGDVDPMFRALEKTKGIIFDMRGYPHETMWALTARLNTRSTKEGPQFYRPLVRVGASASYFFR